MGTDSCVANTLLVYATSVVHQIAKLMTLPVTTQSQFVLLCSTLSLKMVHLQRLQPWDQVPRSACQLDLAIIKAMSPIFHFPSAIGSDGARLASRTALRQMVRPERHRGLGLWKTSSLEADAALLSAQPWLKLLCMRILTLEYLSMEPVQYLCLRSGGGSSMTMPRSVVGPLTLTIFLQLLWKETHPKFNIVCHTW